MDKKKEEKPLETTKEDYKDEIEKVKKGIDWLKSKVDTGKITKFIEDVRSKAKPIPVRPEAEPSPSDQPPQPGVDEKERQERLKAFEDAMNESIKNERELREVENPSEPYILPEEKSEKKGKPGAIREFAKKLPGAMKRSIEFIVKGHIDPSLVEKINEAKEKIITPENIKTIKNAYDEAMKEYKKKQFKDAFLSFEALIAALIGFGIGAIVTNDLRWAVVFGAVGYGLGLAYKMDLWSYISSFFSSEEKKKTAEFKRSNKDLAKAVFQRTINYLSSGKGNFDKLRDVTMKMVDELRKEYGVELSNYAINSINQVFKQIKQFN